MPLNQLTTEEIEKFVEKESDTKEGVKNFLWSAPISNDTCEDIDEALHFHAFINGWKPETMENIIEGVNSKNSCEFKRSKESIETAKKFERYIYNF